MPFREVAPVATEAPRKRFVEVRPESRTLSAAEVGAMNAPNPEEAALENMTRNRQSDARNAGLFQVRNRLIREQQELSSGPQNEANRQRRMEIQGQLEEIQTQLGRSTAAEKAGFVLPVAGGVIGSLVGGPGLGGLVAGTIGGASGAAAGRLERGGTIQEAGRDAAIDAAFSLGIPLAGRAVRGALGAGLRRGASSFRPGGEEAFETALRLADEARARGEVVHFDTLSPGTVFGSGPTQSVERIGGAMLGGGGLRRSAEESGERALAEIERTIRPSLDAVDSLGDAPLAVRKAVQDLYESRLEEARTLYRQVDDVAHGKPVDLTGVQGIVAKAVARASQGISGASRKTAAVLNRLAKKGANTTYEGALDIRSGLGDEIMGLQRSGGKGMIALLKEVQQAVDAAVSDAVAAAEPSLANTLAQAQKHWHVAKTTFEKGPLKALLVDDPDRAARWIANVRSARVVQVLRQQLDPAEFEVARGVILRDILTKAGQREGEEIPFGFVKAFEKNKGLVEALFPGDEGKRLLSTATHWQWLGKNRLTTGAVRGESRAYWLAIQAAPILAMDPTAILTIAGPRALTRLMTNRRFAVAMVKARMASQSPSAFAAAVKEVQEAAERAVPGITAALVAQRDNQQEPAQAAAR